MQAQDKATFFSSRTFLVHGEINRVVFDRCSDGLRRLWERSWIASKFGPDRSLQLVALGKSGLASLDERWVESAKVHHLHVDAVCIPISLASFDTPALPQPVQQG